jgi:hypothetical protein
MGMNVFPVSGILFDNFVRYLHHQFYFDQLVEEYSNEVIEILIL